MTIRFLEVAQRELDEVVEFHESQALGLGRAFQMMSSQYPTTARWLSGGVARLWFPKSQPMRTLPRGVQRVRHYPLA